MDGKTERLRDIFLDVTGSEAVTERQEEGHGSLPSDADVDERIAAVVGRMRERFDFGTSLSDDALVRVVRGYYADESDAEIARSLDDAGRRAVARARVDLHLVRDRDRDAPFELDALRPVLDGDRPLDEFADAHDVSASTARRYRRVLAAMDERAAVDDRFREEFETVIEDRDLTERLTSGVERDGFDGATDGQETTLGN